MTDESATGALRSRHAPPPMRFPARLRMPFAFDPDRLAADLRQLSRAAWIKHFVTQNYHGDWSVIPLRATAGAQHPIQMIYSNPTATAYTDTPLLAECP